MIEEEELTSFFFPLSLTSPPCVLCCVQELGPRFTLKLLSVQKGILNWKHGEFEWCNIQYNQSSTGYNRRTYAL